MNKLIDKAIIFTLCIVSHIEYGYDVYIVVPVICVLAAGAFMSYIENDAVNMFVFIAYCAVCILFPNFLFFLPLVCYDIFFSSRKYALLAAIIPLGAGLSEFPLIVCIVTALFIALSYLIKLRTVSLEKIRSKYIALRDTTKEFSLQLESKNKELMEKQDYEINLATLNERNRIARDIHDSVGHILSNSILQTGAMMATCKDEEMRERLGTLKETLAHGMDSVRSSIHDLHEESIDLYTETKTLADNFHFCDITMDYDIESSPDKKVKYALLAVIKEALSNVIKHSDATSVKITLREHPALYQLIIKDNGSKKEMSGEGIGLKNIEQRINGLKGIVNIGYDNGFTVFISIPKEAAE
jgi:signal transduction histidine kinase